MGMNYDGLADISPICIDIETCGLENAADFLEPVIPDARLKDPAKIEQDIKDKEAARIQKLALDYNVGRIAAIGWWEEKNGLDVCICRDEDEEAVVLKEVWSLCKHRTIVGYNLKQFDLRYMVQRSRYLRVPHPVGLDLGKYSRKGIVDLFSELTFNDGTYDQGAMRRTLKAFCKRFGIPCDDAINGADIPALIAAGEWEKVKAHVTSDVQLTVELAKRLGVITRFPVEVAV